jgi:hypothetical protein
LIVPLFTSYRSTGFSVRELAVSPAKAFSGHHHKNALRRAAKAGPPAQHDPIWPLVPIDKMLCIVSSAHNHQDARPVADNDSRQHRRVAEEAGRLN